MKWLLILCRLSWLLSEQKTTSWWNFSALPSLCVFHLTWLLLLYTNIWFSVYCFHCIHGIVTKVRSGIGGKRLFDLKGTAGIPAELCRISSGQWMKLTEWNWHECQDATPGLILSPESTTVFAQASHDDVMHQRSWSDVMRAAVADYTKKIVILVPQCLRLCPFLSKPILPFFPAARGLVWDRKVGWNTPVSSGSVWVRHIDTVRPNTPHIR
jgi:hypothetical protein